MKAGIVAAALVGSVAASQHNRHEGFHMRRGGYAAAAPADEVCTVYTTVYVTGCMCFSPSSARPSYGASKRKGERGEAFH